MQTAASTTATGDMVMSIPSVAIPAHGMAIGLISSTCGPRPWGDTGCLLGVVGHANTGTYSTQAGVLSFEGTAYSGMATPAKVAMGHSMPPMNMTASGFPAAPTGPNGDFANNRLAFISWPSQASWPGGQNAADGDPTKWLLLVQNGSYDDWIAYFALALKNWGHPTIVRLMWEFNDNDPPWASGHQNTTLHTFTQWTNAFIGAWRRIFTIVRGTQAAVTALSPGYGANLRVGGTAISTINGGNAIRATNALFHYNAQFTGGGASNGIIDFDAPWPGDAYVHFAGVETYRPLQAIPGRTTRTFTDEINAHDQSSTGNNIAFYTEYGPGGTRNQTLSFLGNGESGVRYQTSAGTQPSIDFAANTLTGSKANAAWKFNVYWDGGSAAGNGLSTIDDGTMPATVVTAVQNWLQDPWMLPNLTTTWDVNTVGPWSAAYQNRRQIATNNVCFGNTMLASMSTFVANAGSSPTTAPTLAPASYGFGNWTAISFTLNPA